MNEDKNVAPSSDVRNTDLRASPELLAVVTSIVENFVDRAFGVDSVQMLRIERSHPSPRRKSRSGTLRRISVRKKVNREPKSCKQRRLYTYDSQASGKYGKNMS